MHRSVETAGRFGQAAGCTGLCLPAESRPAAARGRLRRAEDCLMHVPSALPQPAPIADDRGFLTLAWLLVIVGLLVGNAAAALWDQDEAAYAGFARKMLLGGDWVTPAYPYAQPHRKPPLHFWAIAGSFAVLGINEFALRLPGMLSILLSAVLVATRGAFLVGRRAARLGGLVLASSLFVLTLGKVALVDALLLLCQTVAALAMLRGVTAPSWRSTVVLWVAVAAGLLVKGPPILILIVGMLVALLVLHPRRWNLVHLHPWFGLPLAFVPLVVWGWLAWQADPRLVLFLIEWYILRRVGGSVFGQFGLPGTHFLLMFVCLMPWTPFILPALKQAWSGLRRRRLAMVLVAAWLFGGWLLWEIPSSKLPTYALGGYPAIALLIGRVITRPVRGEMRWSESRLLRLGAVVAIGVAIGLALAFAVLAVHVGAWWAKFAGVIPGLVLVSAAFAAVGQFKSDRVDRGIKFGVIGALAANVLFWLIVVPGIEPVRGATRRVAAFAAAHLPPGSTVLVARRVLSPSLPFYVEQAGLKFRDVLDEGARPPLSLDWSLLRRKGVKAFAESVRAQSPPKMARGAEDALRLTRARAALDAGGPLAIVLDQAQAEALADRLTGVRVERLGGFLIDKLDFTSYIVAVVDKGEPASPAPP
jgi:4-amino-4-deoxy-L-arabinose transferase-like glycosyltransferase